MELRTLESNELEIAHNTMSSHAFFGVAVNALIRGHALSAVRAADGEKGALSYCENNSEEAALLCFSPGWRNRFGCEGITCKEFLERIHQAVINCTYFAPTHGFFDCNYRVASYFPKRELYLEEGYQYIWPLKYKMGLMKQAGRVLVVNRDSKVAERIAWKAKSVHVEHVALSNWRDAEAVLKTCESIEAPLALLSVGPASKWLSPALALQGRVCLDIGQAADTWVEG